MPHCAHAAVESVHAAPVLARRSLAFHQQHFRFDSADDALRNLILNREDVGDIAVVSFCPKMGSRLCLDQLAGDANSLASFSDTALKQISNTKIAGYLFHINRAPLVHERRIARDDKEPAM